MSTRLRNEALLAVLLMAVGLLALPAAIFVVGGQIMGPYEGENGLASLAGAIWTALGTGQPAAWTLVLSPYLVVQLFRLALGLRRFGGPVKRVTD
jgi:hypothetical protein